MKARPILMSAPMVRALLDGRKTQTRRLVKPPKQWAKVFPIADPTAVTAPHILWWWDGKHDRVGVSQCCPYGAPGDRLWVRETWKPHSLYAGMMPSEIPRTPVFYCADESYAPSNTPRNPSLFMPRWASRLTLEITEARVERLQDISEADALAEGIERLRFPEVGDWGWPQARYRALWESINGPGSWDANPCVWVMTFNVHKQNVDA